MFIQVITGTVTDADGFQRSGEQWDKELRPGAPGFLGSTAGATADGRFVVAARFDSADAAAKNNERPEQGEWYAGFEQTVSNVAFHDCNTVITMGGDEKDNAGFVQVMVGTIKDRAKFDALNEKVDEFEAAFADFRRDVLGDTIAVHDDGSGYTHLVYFESEAKARAGEKLEPPPAIVALMGEMDEATEVVDYLDLSDPMIT